MAAHPSGSYGAWIFVALTCCVVGACFVTPEVVTGPCKTDVDCPDDGIACTKEVCNAATGFCDRQPQDLPLGDKGCDDENPCTDDFCSNGKCAHQTAATAPSDGNDCTADECTGGLLAHTPLPDGTACGLDGSLHCTGGSCKCISATDCGTSTECITFECNANACSSATLEKGTFIDGKAVGDCLMNVCDGTDKVIAVADMSDVPPDPTAGNCQQKSCDDQGNVIDIDDPSDVPSDDFEVCTIEGCNGGTPIDHTPVADLTLCGSEPKCELVPGGGEYQAIGHDECKSGSCTTPPPVPCGFFTCDAANTACLSTCQNGNDCIPGALCDVVTNTCKLVAGDGTPCMNAAECQSGFCTDGVCCASLCNGLCAQCDTPGQLGMCRAIMSGTDPDNECAGANVCDGNEACKSP